MDVFERLHIPRSAVRSDIVLSYTIPILVVTSLLEFVLIRNFSRVGVFLPQNYLLRAAYDILVSIGSVMFNLASLLATAVFLILSIVIARSRQLQLKPRRLTAFIFAAIALLSVMFLMAIPGAWASLTYIALSLTAVFLVAKSVPSDVGRIGKLVVALISATFLTTYLFQAVPLLDPFPDSAVLNTTALVIYNAGEIFALAAGILLFLGYVRKWKNPKPIRELLIVLTISAGFLLSYLRGAWLVSIISMWTLGFTFYLPFPVYLFALAAFLFLVLNNLKKNPYMSYGLIFLLLSGRMMQLTYLNLLAILGFLLVVRYMTPVDARSTGKSVEYPRNV